MQTVVSVKNPMGSTIPCSSSSSTFYVAHERLAFVHGNIRVADHRGELVDRVATGQPLRTQGQGMPT
jgi:hypothetical protein